MSDSKYVFEADIYVSKKKIKMIYLIGLALFLLAVGCVIWSSIYWEEYTFYVKDIITGEMELTGLASVLYYWGLGFAIAIPPLYGLMWMNIDLKNPSLGVNKEGFFINQDGFKKTFLHWADFERMERQSDGKLWMYMKDPEGVIRQQPGYARPFLSQTYVKTRSPITLNPAEGEQKKIIGLVAKYSGMVR